MGYYTGFHNEGESPVMWGVTAFFNPTGAPALLTNLQAFSSRVRRQGLWLLIVELAFDDAPHVVPEALADRVVRVRSETVLWQKERLLNIGLRALPADASHVAWLDGDVLFENDDWVRETRDALERSVVVQPFESAVWLPPDAASAPASLPAGLAEGHEMRGFGATIGPLEGQERRRALVDFMLHGHTGFAWAARRDMLERHGLFDRAILGGGDQINAHVFADDQDYLRGRGYCALMLTPLERQAVAAWGRAAAADTQGRVGWVRGRVLHLFHGWLSRRAYDDRHLILREARFDPLSDIDAAAGECWRWTTDKPGLHARTREYFGARQMVTPA